jgi:ferrous iron transport protein A
MPPLTLDDLVKGEEGILDSIELPDAESRRLMELGFLPGTLVVAAGRSPFGDPRIFRVDGSEVALRRETAARLILRSPQSIPEKES